MKHYNVGQVVLINDPKFYSDLWTHSFIGTIIAIENDIISVEDQSGIVFDIEASQHEILEWLW